jgi:hypothetical protein
VIYVDTEIDYKELELEDLKDKASYHYKCFIEAFNALCELDENEAQSLMQWLEECGGC